jgi:hypothetical protein
MHATIECARTLPCALSLDIVCDTGRHSLLLPAPAGLAGAGKCGAGAAAATALVTTAAAAFPCPAGIFTAARLESDG